MKVVLFFSMSIIMLSVKGWPSVKKSFEFYTAPSDMHIITDCMHVTSEAGDYVFKKTPHSSAEHKALAIEDESIANVCGLYIIGEPDTIIEITMRQYNVNCETGGLMAFVDGWELNGEYFPGIKDHHKLIEDRVVEFCNNYRQWPHLSNKKFFRSSQNGALLQYRIPVRGSFIANVRFHKITQPCNILVQDMSAIYNLANYGHRRNCTLSALFPAVIALGNIKVGAKSIRQEKVNYDCDLEDHLDIGGSNGLDAYAMEKSSMVCGFSTEKGPDQGIFCGVTTIRLISSGRYQNQATIILRKAEESDLENATLICSL